MGPSDDLADRAAAVLGRSAMGLDELRRGLDLPPAFDRPDDLQLLLQDHTSFDRVRRGIVHVPSLLEGTSWTVRVDADDAAHGFLRTSPGLAPFGWWLIGGEVELLDASGTSLGALHTDGWMLDGQDTDVVLGPDGWLDGLAGGWARVEVVGGSLRLGKVDVDEEPDPAVVAALRRGFDDAVDAERSFDPPDEEPAPDPRFAIVEGPLLEALVAEPEVLGAAPLASIPALLRAAGLVMEGQRVAEEGFDWEAMRAWRIRNRLRVLRGLDGERVVQVAQLLAALDDVAAGTVPDDLAGVPWAVLDDAEAAEAVEPELQARGVDLSDLIPLAEPLGELGLTSVGPVWLRASILDHLDDPTAATALLEAAAPGSGHGPALVALAGRRADAGDAAGALRLLEEAGIEAPTDDDGDDLEGSQLLRLEVARFAHRPKAMAGRNDPCPCGSGRKYKVCHLGREVHPFDERAAWLYAKAQRFLLARFAEELDDLDDLEPPDDRGASLVGSMVLADVALHEGGAFEAFLAARHAVLPHDEAVLAAEWSAVQRGVFEVVALGRDTLTLRHLFGGDELTIANVAPAPGTEVGSLLVGRPLPVGGVHRAFSGFLPVPRHVLSRVLWALEGADPHEVAEALHFLLAPTDRVNSDHDPLVAHRIDWLVVDPAAVAEVLVAAGFRAGRPGGWTFVRATRHEGEAVVATASLLGRHLVVEVDSAVRAAEFEDLLTEPLEGIAALDDTYDEEHEWPAIDPASRRTPPPIPTADDLGLLGPRHQGRARPT